MRHSIMSLWVLVACLGVLPAAMAAQPAFNKENASLTVLSDQLTIWYFYLSTCPYCRQQEPILHQLERRYGIHIEPVSLDGQPPQLAALGDFRMPGPRDAQLSIRSTPTMYLYFPATKQAAPLSVGLIQAPQLKRRIVQTAERAGWLEKVIKYRQSVPTIDPAYPQDRSAQQANNAAKKPADTVTDRILRKARTND